MDPQPQQVQTTSVHKPLVPLTGALPPSTLIPGDSEHPSLMPAIGPCNAAPEVDIPHDQNDLLAESVQCQRSHPLGTSKGQRFLRSGNYWITYLEQNWQVQQMVKCHRAGLHSFRCFITMRGDIISGASDEAMFFYSTWNLYSPVRY
eukprot:g39868.t1